MNTTAWVRRFVPVARGKSCPVCGERTERHRTPAVIRLPRFLIEKFGTDCSYRSCRSGHWRGLALH